MQLIDGKKVSEEIKGEIAREVSDITAGGGKKPHLAAVLVGDDGASRTYVSAKVKACQEVGFNSTLVELPATTTEENLLGVIARLNSDEDVDGFIVQLPLPSHISELKVTMAIHPSKDVDGFHPASLGKMVLNLPTFISATPFGIIQLLDRYGIETSGRHCVVIGRSQIVGMPMSILMGRRDKVGNCTVTLTHSKTRELKKHTVMADIIIAALGNPGFLKGDMVKEGVVVIDVGITRVEDATKKSGYRLTGDVDFESVAPKCSYITPVPGGVGPMTIASLLMNTLKAVRMKQTSGLLQ